MAHSFSFGSGAQPNNDIPANNQGSSVGFTTSHQKSNEPITGFSFGGGVHQSTQPTTTTLTTQQQIERNMNLLATFSETSHQQNQEEIARALKFIDKARGEYSFGNAQPSHQKVNEPTNTGFSFGSTGFSFGNVQTSHQKSNEPTNMGFTFGSKASNTNTTPSQSSNRQASCRLSTHQEKTEQEVVKLRKEVKLLKKKVEEMAIVEERVKQLEYLQYNKDVKVLLLGDSGVGKSALVHKHLSGIFKRSHLATTEIDITPLEFHHNKGAIVFQLWEFPEDVPNKNVMYAGADCAIILFDVTWRSSYNNAVDVHIPAVRKVCGGIPIVLLGNKIDIRSDDASSSDDVFLTYNRGDT